MLRMMWQDALQRGAISGAELQQWLNLAARPLLGPLCSLWPAFRDRVLGNPRFLLVLAIEEVIGCTAKTIAEYQLRKEKFWKVPKNCLLRNSSSCQTWVCHIPAQVDDQRRDV